MYGYICHRCGSHLDPGERCDCDQKHKNMYQRNRENYESEERLGGIGYADTLRACRAVS